jgi:hypothetical protein
LRPFLRKGVIRHREMNLTGCAVLGYLMVNGPSVRSEIVADRRVTPRWGESLGRVGRTLWFQKLSRRKRKVS